MIRLLNWLGPLKQKAQKTVIRSRRKLLERSNLSSPRSRPPRDFGNAEACCRYERRRRTVGLPAAKSLLRKTTAVDTRTPFPAAAVSDDQKAGDRLLSPSFNDRPAGSNISTAKEP